eukprot:jgi/Mesvir1/11810/Mv00167-RA.1
MNMPCLLFQPIASAPRQCPRLALRASCCAPSSARHPPLDGHPLPSCCHPHAALLPPSRYYRQTTVSLAFSCSPGAALSIQCAVQLAAVALGTYAALMLPLGCSDDDHLLVSCWLVLIMLALCTLCWPLHFLLASAYSAGLCTFCWPLHIVLGCTHSAGLMLACTHYAGPLSFCWRLWPQLEGRLHVDGEPRLHVSSPTARVQHSRDEASLLHIQGLLDVTDLRSGLKLTANKLEWAPATSTLSLEDRVTLAKEGCFQARADHVQLQMGTVAAARGGGEDGGEGGGCDGGKGGAGGGGRGSGGAGTEGEMMTRGQAVTHAGGNCRGGHRVPYDGSSGAACHPEGGTADASSHSGPHPMKSSRTHGPASSEADASSQVGHGAAPSTTVITLTRPLHASILLLRPLLPFSSPTTSATPGPRDDAKPGAAGVRKTREAAPIAAPSTAATTTPRQQHSRSKNIAHVQDESDSPGVDKSPLPAMGVKATNHGSVLAAATSVLPVGRGHPQAQEGTLVDVSVSREITWDIDSGRVSVTGPAHMAAVMPGGRRIAASARGAECRLDKGELALVGDVHADVANLSMEARDMVWRASADNGLVVLGNGVRVTAYS